MAAAAFAAMFVLPSFVPLDDLGGGVWWAAVGVLVLACTVLGPAVNPPPRSGPARLLIAAMGSFALASILHLLTLGGPDDSALLAGISALYLLGYLLIGVSMVRLATARMPGGDPEGRIDSLIVMVSMGAVLHGLIVSVAESDPVGAGVNPVIFAVLPLVQAPVLTANIRLLIAGTARLPAAWMYLAATAVGLVANLEFVTSGMQISELAIIGWFLAYALVACASLHPSARQLTLPSTASASRHSLGRLAVIGVALAALPLTMIISGGRWGSDVQIVAAVVCVVLVVWRMARLLRERERAAEQLQLRADRDAALAAISRAAVTASGPEDFLPQLEAALEGTLGTGCRLVQCDDPRGRGVLGAPLGGGDGWLVVESASTDEQRAADEQFLQTCADLAGAALRRWSAEALVRHRSLHDGLTALPNRALVLDRLGLALARARRGRHRVAVLFLDLDGFKEVNDTLGHATGDALLQGVAQRLQAAIRPGDTVGRLAGDEFVVIGEDTDQADALALADRLLAHVSTPYRLETRDVTIAASIGVACVEPHQDTAPETLLREADAAMYRAKDLGKGRVAMVDDQLRLQAGRDRRDDMEPALRGAAGRDELSLVFQPLVALGADGTDETIGAEALVRWRHPIDGPIPPAAFIPLAESNGLIIPLGDWILHEACRQAAAWRDLLPESRAFRLFVNVSPVQLADPGFIERLTRSITETGARSTDLGVELTETAMDCSAAEIGETLQRIRDLGLQVALDGGPSLTQLPTLPLDLVKLDRSLVAALAEPGREGARVAALAALATELDLRMHAEGIETHEQLSAARQLGVHQAQGYLLGLPGPPEEILHLLGGALPVAAR